SPTDGDCVGGSPPASALGRRQLLHGFVVHPEHLPNVSVQVGQGAVVHESQILLGIDVGGAAVLRGGVVGQIDDLPAVATESQHHLAGGGGRNRAAGERVPLVVGEQHHIDRIGPDHA